MKRLKINLNRVGFKNKLSYIYCGEYGDQGNRCHLHLCLFGLPSNLKNTVKESWKAKYKINGVIKKYPIGLVQCNDIKPGGIRYILKYMDYSPKGLRQKEEWIKNNLQPPFCKHSCNLGQNLIYDQIEYIKKTGQLKTGDAEKTIFLPKYWKRKLGIYVVKNYDWIRNEMRQNGIKSKYINYPWYDFKDIKDYQNKKSKLQEKNRLDKLKKQGLYSEIYEQE